MKRLFKVKTIQVALVLSFMFHVFFIGYFDRIFIKLPVEKIEKQSVAYITLGKKINPFTSFGNSHTEEQDELSEAQDSENQDISEESIIPEKSILKKIIPEKIQAFQPDGEEKVIYPDRMIPKITEEQTDAFEKKDLSKNILTEENITDSEKQNEEILVSKITPIKEILPEKKILPRQKELKLENKKVEKLPVQIPEEPEKKKSTSKLKTENEIGIKNPKEEIASSENSKKMKEYLKSIPEKSKETPSINSNKTEESLSEKPENENTGQSQRENIKNAEEDVSNTLLNDGREVNEKILDFTGELYGDDVNPPALKNYEKPIYPIVLREREIEGKVMLDVLLDRIGLVKEIKIYKSSGYDAFDKAAIQSVHKWRFKPAGKAGRHMACRVFVPVHFQIK